MKNIPLLTAVAILVLYNFMASGKNMNINLKNTRNSIYVLIVMIMI